MIQENPFPGIHKDPPPISSDVQKVTLLEGGGWIAEIIDPNKNDSRRNLFQMLIKYWHTHQPRRKQDFQFMGPAAGINEQRYQALSRRMGK